MATQFQATHARAVFPCLDEPGFKSTFNVTMCRKKNMTSLSSMPIASTRMRGDDWFCDVFEKSAVVMPTYLLAFAVTDFDYVETVSNGTYFNNSQKLVSTRQFSFLYLIVHTLNRDYFVTDSNPRTP